MLVGCRSGSPPPVPATPLPCLTMQACNPNSSPNPNHAGVLEKLKAACLDWAFWGDSYTHVQPPRPMCLEAPSCAEAELVCNCRNFGAGHEDDLVGSWLDTDQPDRWLTQTAGRDPDEVSIDRSETGRAMPVIAI